MKEQFGANAPRKKLTVRIKTDLYARLHAYASERLAPHNAVVEKAILVFLSGKCFCGKAHK